MIKIKYSSMHQQNHNIAALPLFTKTNILFFCKFGLEQEIWQSNSYFYPLFVIISSEFEICWQKLTQAGHQSWWSTRVQGHATFCRGSRMFASKNSTLGNIVRKLITRQKLYSLNMIPCLPVIFIISVSCVPLTFSSTVLLTIAASFLAWQV